MGCSQSSPEQIRNREIDDMLSREKVLASREVKCLLLGAGESGKSTVLKQMALLSVGTHSNAERHAYREIIYSNAVQSMQVVVLALEDLGLPLSSSRNTSFADHFRRLDIQPDVMDDRGNLHPELRDGLISLWNEPAVRACVAQSHRFQLNDSAQYFFAAAPRIGAPGYLPSDADILRSRVRTTGITEAKFRMSERLSFRCFDVGGQRSERKKWIHCFEDVNIVFFVVAISEFNQTLREDETINRVSEACVLFESISNSRWFIRSGLLLFLNKIDLLESKLQHTLFSDSFPDYRGRNTLVEVQQYMLSIFKSLCRKTIYAHFTCATDTHAMKVVLASVENHIIVTNLNDSNMML
ncbi:guanine nucleotide binding protein (G protein), alpha, other [Microbotryum lychnidis-dioicae p1A1 Lamole]|uniref:Guanine nucleotide binding protein (G protein), alpha, other n=1 Tax=Microbotryum lychnidis-dioicae (strain p1A1 Lamole / MvSl-1064) TaxID=683840 RepID=U5HJ77_USTV1|nr:guanine nucleotide binding protein (G protein), alpha, other [Microbotryum lychnidis-dioicae p1A1 Lamole]|eukprot:KDE02377.1 guanine nucleotide binding protein (G protein), alpha, other [Microbotryum lychnidis-dioicae p1A1 Lamole]